MDDPTREAVKRLEYELAELYAEQARNVLQGSPRRRRTKHRQADPQAQALAILRDELEFLQARNLAPTERALIFRMIERALELKPIFAKIFDPAHVRPHTERGGRVFLNDPVPGWPESRTPEQFRHELNMERRRRLWVIIATAATVPEMAKDRRDALRDLPDLLDKFGKLANEMAIILERINHKALFGHIQLPDWFTLSPIELMHRAAEDSGLSAYHQTTQDELDSLACRHDRPLPTLQKMINSLSYVTRAELEHAEPILYKFKQKAFVMGDYARNLLEAMARYCRGAAYLRPIEFTPPELVILAEVLTDDELPKDPERGMRGILQEHRAADPPG